MKDTVNDVHHPPGGKINLFVAFGILLTIGSLIGLAIRLLLHIF